jgi:hypothetical protein
MAGRPISSTPPEIVAKLQQLVHEDRHRTIQGLADERGIGYGKCQWILTAEFGIHRVIAKFVARILTADLKQQHVNNYEELHQITSEDATFLSRVITGDVTKNNMTIVAHPPYFSVSPTEDITERPPFRHNSGDRGRTAGGTEHPLKTQLPRCI